MTEPIVDAAPAIDFDLKSLPKVSLHDHLDGGLRPATIIELAQAVGHTLPSTDPVALGEWFRESADSGSLVRYLETFDHTVAVMQTKEGLFRVAKEFVEDLADDGVVYGEVRWAPEQHLQKGLSLDEVVEAVQEGLEAGVDAVAETGREIQVGQLITAMRHADRGQEIAELAVRHRNKGAVGFDIAGAEDGFLPSRFKDAFTYLAEQNFPRRCTPARPPGSKASSPRWLTGGRCAWATASASPKTSWWSSTTKTPRATRTASDW